MTDLAMESVPWETGTWLNPPEAVQHDGGALLVTAREGSDFWRTTSYDFVHDDGHGLPDTAQSDGHYGLDIMHERAGRIGGLLVVEARPGGGTRVRLIFPIAAPLNPTASP